MRLLAGGGVMSVEQKRMEEEAKRAAQRAVNQLRMSRQNDRAGAGQVTPLARLLYEALLCVRTPMLSSTIGICARWHVLDRESRRFRFFMIAFSMHFSCFWLQCRVGTRVSHIALRVCPAWLRWSKVTARCFLRVRILPVFFFAAAARAG